MAPSFQADCDTAPKHLSATSQVDAQKDIPVIKDVWSSLVHPDDPFLWLIPCEIPPLSSVLQHCQHNHLEAYKRLGLSVSGTNDFIVVVFNCKSVSFSMST